MSLRSHYTLARERSRTVSWTLWEILWVVGLIFLTNETNGGSPVHVIKEQTMKRRKHWKEKILLNKIHQHGVYPGVVRAGFLDTLDISRPIRDSHWPLG